MTYLDTNILVYLLEGHKQYSRFIAETLENLSQQNELLISSTLTVTEFLAATSSSSLKTLQQVPRLEFIALDESLAEQAANLQRKHSALKIGDAIHLSTAIHAQAKLLFTNDKVLAKVASGYTKVQGLDNR